MPFNVCPTSFMLYGNCVKIVVLKLVFMLPKWIDGNDSACIISHIALTTICKKWVCHLAGNCLYLLYRYDYIVIQFSFKLLLFPQVFILHPKWFASNRFHFISPFPLYSGKRVVLLDSIHNNIYGISARSVFRKQRIATCIGDNICFK